LQVLLRKQVAAATKLWSLPPEFEAISRDVWSLALTLKGEIPHIDSGNEEQEKGERAPMAANNDEDDSEGFSSASEEPESENGDTGVANLLDRLSEDDDSDPENSLNETQPVIQLRGEGLVSRFPYYINVAVLLVSCWILRLPVTYSDILK
jgi:RNA polymerase I-specific transcription initiation factor RRN7